jgi:hypothetical protein
MRVSTVTINRIERELTTPIPVTPLALQKALEWRGIYEWRLAKRTAGGAGRSSPGFCTVVSAALLSTLSTTNCQTFQTAEIDRKFNSKRSYSHATL